MSEIDPSEDQHTLAYDRVADHLQASSQALCEAADLLRVHWQRLDDEEQRRLSTQLQFIQDVAVTCQARLEPNSPGPLTPILENGFVTEGAVGP